MQVLSDRSRSAAAATRRYQIIQATIVAIAEVRYPRTSFIEIARRAGLSSTRLISYHFTDRTELRAAVASHVLTELRAAVAARVRTASPPAAVRGYIEANVQYMDTHRAQMAALTSLLCAGALYFSADQGTAGINALTSIIDAGRRSGQFRNVDPGSAAAVVQRAVEGVPLHLRNDPDADLTDHAEELIRFFDAALLVPANERTPT